MGFGTSHSATIEVVAKAIKNKNADLYVETSQAQPSAVISAIKSLGAERVLFGTDATYFGKDHYENYQDLVRQMRRSLSADDFSAVMHGNAEKLFHL
jgi:predicted TIM-barrel fold metal-dependent hydrolase